MKLKSLNAPKSWSFERKTKTWVSFPMSGMRRELCLSVLMVLRDLLKYVKNAKEARSLIHEKKILINDKVVKKVGQGVALFDVLSFTNSKKVFRLTVNEFGKLGVVEDSKHKNFKVVKLRNKTVLNKKVVQLNFTDGSNLLVDFKNSKVKLGECVLVDFVKGFVKVLDYSSKNLCLVVLGSHAGSVGVVVEDYGSLVEVKMSNKSFKTLKEYVYVYGLKTEEVKVR